MIAIDAWLKHGENVLVSPGRFIGYVPIPDSDSAPHNTWAAPVSKYYEEYLEPILTLLDRGKP